MAAVVSGAIANVIQVCPHALPVVVSPTATAFLPATGLATTPVTTAEPPSKVAACPTSRCRNLASHAAHGSSDVATSSERSVFASSFASTLSGGSGGVSPAVQLSADTSTFPDTAAVWVSVFASSAGLPWRTRSTSNRTQPVPSARGWVASLSATVANARTSGIEPSICPFTAAMRASAMPRIRPV